MSLESSSDEEESKNCAPVIGKRSASQARLDETPLVISVETGTNEEDGRRSVDVSDLQKFLKAKRARREND